MVMGSLFLNMLLLLLSLIIAVLIASVIGIAVIIVGFIIEAGEGNDDGFFHKICDELDYMGF